MDSVSGFLLIYAVVIGGLAAAMLAFSIVVAVLVRAGWIDVER